MEINDGIRKIRPIVDENHGFISPNYEKHPSDSSLSIPILNAMANYKHQYSILYQLKSSDLAKYIRRGVDVNYGYTSCIYPNHNPVYESLMLWSITVANIEHYYLRLIIHMGKQINNILWYCDSKKKKKKIEAVWEYTVYPKKYAHGFCFAVLCCGYTLTDFPISIKLTLLALWQSNDCPSASKATLTNIDKYFMWIHYERLHNHNKAKHNKAVCIFLGIYCTSLFWRKSWFYLSESWRTSIWIITILPNPYMSHAHNKHLVFNLCICIEHAPLKRILRHLMAKSTVAKWYSHFYWNPHCISPNRGKPFFHPNHTGLYRCIYPNPVSEKIVSCFRSYKQRLVVRPHADKMPAKVMTDTRRAVVTGSSFCFTKLILHHPRAVTAASRRSTIADLALTTANQLEPCIPWSRPTHILPCHILTHIVWVLVCATAPSVRSPAKASAILNESVTAVTASRFSPMSTLVTEAEHKSEFVFPTDLPSRVSYVVSIVRNLEKIDRIIMAPHCILHYNHGTNYTCEVDHDDVIKWKHFPHYWPFMRGIHRDQHKGQWRGALMFSLICAWINGWVNNHEAGDLRCHRAHYDVIVM